MDKRTFYIYKEKNIFQVLFMIIRMISLINHLQNNSCLWYRFYFHFIISIIGFKPLILLREFDIVDFSYIKTGKVKIWKKYICFGSYIVNIRIHGRMFDQIRNKSVKSSKWIWNIEFIMFEIRCDYLPKISVMINYLRR